MLLVEPQASGPSCQKIVYVFPKVSSPKDLVIENGGNVSTLIDFIFLVDFGFFFYYHCTSSYRLKVNLAESGFSAELMAFRYSFARNLLGSWS